jgi:hypothetical protein
VWSLPDLRSEVEQRGWSVVAWGARLRDSVLFALLDPQAALVVVLLVPGDGPTAYYAECANAQDLTAAPRVLGAGPLTGPPATLVLELLDRAADPEHAAAGNRPADLVTVQAVSYVDAKQLGEQARDGRAVLIDLTGADERNANRLLDFAAGVALGLRGHLERVTSRVFLLTPPAP